jgi:uncharacterized protein
LPHSLKFRALEIDLAVCKLVPDAQIPAWASYGVFFCVTRALDELSIACPADLVPGGVLAERGWVPLKLEGPFPFSLTGVLSSFLQPLAEAQIPIFAVSTFNTDYVLVKRETLPRAVAALEAAGHQKIE